MRPGCGVHVGGVGGFWVCVRVGDGSGHNVGVGSVVGVVYFFLSLLRLLLPLHSWC